MTLAQHSAETVEHYTPPDLIGAARRTMGRIDLDPATTAVVNDQTVKAGRFFTAEDSGLGDRPWHGAVWLNPPGGKVGNRSSAAVWWAKLAAEYLAGRVEQAVFLGFTIEILATSQDAPLWLGDLPFCVPRRRIQFLQERDGAFLPGEKPPHANIVVYIPPRGDPDAVARFAREFSAFGRVATPAASATGRYDAQS